MNKKVFKILICPWILFGSVNAMADSYNCYFWQPDQDVEIVVVSDNDRSQSISLSNKTQYVKILMTEELGLSIAHFEAGTQNLLSVARGRFASEVSLSTMNPRFSVSCNKL